MEEISYNYIKIDNYHSKLKAIEKEAADYN